jgi:hypothetical protein
VTERERRLAENEAMWRSLNEADPPAPGRVGFVFCECARASCASQLEIAWGDYERVRSDPTSFVVLPGHEEPEIETVVRAEGGYAVVEKEGEAAEIAERSDPRS